MPETVVEHFYYVPPRYGRDEEEEEEEGGDLRAAEWKLETIDGRRQQDVD